MIRFIERCSLRVQALTWKVDRWNDTVLPWLEIAVALSLLALVGAVVFYG